MLLLAEGQAVKMVVVDRGQNYPALGRRSMGLIAEHWDRAHSLGRRLRPILVYIALQQGQSSQPEMIRTI